MSVRLVAVFSLIVAMPLALLGWLGGRLIHDERERVESERAVLYTDLLNTIRSDIVDVVQRWEIEFQRLTESSVGFGTSALRDLARSTPSVECAFRLDETGALVYPNLRETASRFERSFLSATADYWTQGWPFLERDKSSESFYQAAENSGWFVWYWSNGSRFLYWTRLGHGGTFGFEVNRVALLAEIIAELPANTGDTEILPGASVAWVDEVGDVIYRWGGHQPAEFESPVAEVEMPSPMERWRLLYFAREGESPAFLGRANGIRLGAGLGVSALILVALAVYFYRENSRALESARRRVSFVNRVSHELKTPLTNIQLYTELAQRDLESGSENVSDRLGVVVEETQRLGRLIHNVLTFSKADQRGAPVARLEWIPDQIVRGVLETFQPALESAGIEAEFNGNAPAPMRLDRDILEQILGNLIVNVEKYAADGRWLGVSTEQKGSGLRILVSDRGEGIPWRQRRRIFKPFVRLSSRVDEGVSGTGIGLTISRDLARRLGGELKLIRGSHGATFELRL